MPSVFSSVRPPRLESAQINFHHLFPLVAQVCTWVKDIQRITFCYGQFLAGLDDECLAIHPNAKILDSRFYANFRYGMRPSHSSFHRNRGYQVLVLFYFNACVFRNGDLSVDVVESLSSPLNTSG